MRENRQSGSEGGEPQTNAAFLPLSLPVCVSLMALTLVKFRETRSDWHDICATNLELLNSA